MRILSIHPSMTELLFAIGAGDMLVGRTDECDYPKSVRKIPTIGPKGEVAKVLVDVFEPHLVVAGPGQEALAYELGAYYRVFLLNPQTLEQLTGQVREFAQELGKSVEADVLVHDLEIALERLTTRSARFKPVRVYCEISHSPPTSASGYVLGILRCAKAEPFEGDASVERIATFDPQIILSCVPGEEEFNFELLTARDGWGGTRAVRHERLFTIPCWALHHPGPRMIEGIKLLGKYLHGIEVA
jgi:iron complex transport system substrate-binding protein